MQKIIANVQGDLLNEGLYIVNKSTYVHQKETWYLEQYLSNHLLLTWHKIIF